MLDRILKLFFDESGEQERHQGEAIYIKVDTPKVILSSTT